jgi:multiple sugar transport system permease protein
MTSQTLAPAVRAEAAVVRRRRGTRPAVGRRSRAWLAPYLFIFPGFALYALVMLYPSVQTVLLSFRDWQIAPGADSPWVGLDNYIQAFRDPVFVNSLLNALVYTVVTVPAQIVIGLFLAVLLNSKLPGRVAFRVLFYMPVVTSWVVVSLLFRYMFASDGGVANWFGRDVLHVLNGNVAWFQGHWTAMVPICLLGIWKGVGWSMLIFLAALTGVPEEMHEAAAIDGAGAVRRFFSVSLPMIRSSMAVVVILLVIGGFNVFISVQLTTGGGPQEQTQVPLTYMYEQGFSFLDFGYGASISFILTAIVLVVSALQYWWTRRVARDSGY